MINFKNGVKGLLLLCSFCMVIGQKYENETCFESHTRSPGICKRHNECGTAYNAYVNNNIRFDICSYYFDLAIVCCVENIEPTSNRWKPNDNANRPTFSKPSTNKPATARPKPRPVVTTRPVAASRPSISASAKRLAEEKCNEYSEGVTESFGVIALLPDPEVQTFNQPKCDYNQNPLIVGGSEADVGEFPHMGAIGWPSPDDNGYLWLCGGTLISERFLITAGHCTYHSNYGRPTVVRLGDHDLREDVADGAKPITVNIQEIIKHPLYKSPVKYHDLALLKLAYDLEFDSYIRPACLYTSADFNEETVIATGWGTTSYKASYTSNVLRKVSLKVFPNADCQPNFASNRNWKNGFTDDQMCAGDDRGGKDTCQGDSGGPLQVESPVNQCVFYIVGVTGFGGECGNAKGSGVYAIVSHYLDWIEKEVWSK